MLRDGNSLGVLGLQPKALLAHLELRANQTVAADRIIDAVWADGETTRACNLLQVNVRTLRKAFNGEPSALDTTTRREELR